MRTIVTNAFHNSLQPRSTALHRGKIDSLDFVTLDGWGIQGIQSIGMRYEY